MNIFLVFAYIFFIGSISGWIIELFYRRFCTKNRKERKWINPGLCTGPYLPLYGVGLCVLYSIARIDDSVSLFNPIVDKLILFVLMAIMTTIMEYIAGIITVDIFNVRLWDYSEEWKNVRGIICPKFSFYWAILGGIYFFLIHPHIEGAIYWLNQNLSFSFFIGFFFGVFAVDLGNSINLVGRLKKFATENEVVVRYEQIKLQIYESYENDSKKYRFFKPFTSVRPLNEHLKELRETFEERKRKK